MEPSTAPEFHRKEIILSNTVPLDVSVWIKLDAFPISLSIDRDVYLHFNLLHMDSTKSKHLPTGRKLGAHGAY